LIQSQNQTHAHKSIEERHRAACIFLNEVGVDLLPVMDSDEIHTETNSLKYDFVSVSGREAVEVVIKDLVLKYGKEPEKIVCGKLGERDIWGLKLNGELASPIGWLEIEGENKNVNEYQLIDFRMIKQINKQ
jgi:hypothetical protein